MRTPSRIFVVALAVAVGGLLAGCTSGGTGDTQSTVDSTDAVDGGPESTVEPSTSAVTTGAAAWCALAPPSLVAATVGVQLREPTATFTSEEIRCTYVTIPEGELTVAVRFRVEQDHQTFLAYRETVERSADPTTDLPGVGDEAFYRSNEFDIQVTHIVVARKGTVTVQLEAPGTLAACTDLVQAILAQLT